MNDIKKNAIARANENKELIGMARLMHLAYSGDNLVPLSDELIARCRAGADANALLDLSVVLQLWQNRELGLAAQREALSLQQVYTLPANGSAALRVLALTMPGDLSANTPLEFLLEDSDVELKLLYLGRDLPFPDELPAHDVMFVAASEAEEALPLLNVLDALVKDWPRPVLNQPGAIAKLSRDNTCLMFGSVPGVVMPLTVRAGRDALERLARGELAPQDMIGGGTFPLIARPVDSHSGRGLQKIEDAAGAADYLAAQTESTFFVSNFIDYRGADGLYRKYRIVLIEGQPFICHMAISKRWMIHYLNADMEESAAKRDEEARFMETFDTDFALRHGQAFREIYQRAGLNYLGIDCGETSDGRLLLFEVDSNMAVHAMDPVEKFPYKHPQMQKVFGAFRAMLERAASR